jgi:hypothetical protein
MNTSKYILKLEDKGETFSTMTLLLPIEFNEFIGGKKVTIIHSHSTMDKDGKRIYKEKLYKTTQGFYIYLFREHEYLTGQQQMIEVTIHYKQEQSNEFDLFISQVLKQFKNATNNN